jgi:sugar-specific transcriptional regulator TrmB
MDDYDKQIDDNVDSIINQLKNQSRSMKKTVKELPPELKKEEREQYVINKASEIVNGCVEVIGVIQDEIKCAPDPKLIESAATFINAFTSALDAISKFELAQQKITAQKELAQFNAAARIADKKDDDTPKNGLFLSREELLKGVLEYKKDEIREITTPPIDV